jgi:AcrR family transcriptional regulator
MSPEQRRRAIVEAVIPLIIENHSVPSTAAMAEAAQVAEGTIFSVFPDKSTLLHEVVRHSIDPEPICEQLRGVHEKAPFQIQLAELARILLERIDRMITLFHVLRGMPGPGHDGQGDARRAMNDSNETITRTLTTIFEGHKDELVLAPDRAAIAFRGLVFASGHPAFSVGQSLTVDEIVSIVTTAKVTTEVPS